MTQDELNRWTDTIARILADCHNRKLNTADRIASHFAVELSNYGDGCESAFLALYQTRKAMRD